MTEVERREEEEVCMRVIISSTFISGGQQILSKLDENKYTTVI